MTNESKCPVSSGARRHTVAGAGTNAAWWPNQLNLKMLQQHSSLSNPMPDAFDYAAEFKTLDLDAVVKESLRLFPPAWVLARSANVALTLAGTAVPKGAFLFVPIHALHRHPAYWDDPEGFDPDRWLDGRGERAKKAGMYLPFGVGQRRCVGEHLANLEARVALATLLRRVTPELLAGQDLVPEASVTLRPKGGLWMRTASASRGVALAAK